LDGDAVLPLVGRIKAAGMTVSSFQSKVREALRGQLYRHRTLGGHEYPIVVRAEEITISVAEYRPVYVKGDVMQPGEQKFRPGINVRQAVALAGGYDIMRFRAKDPFFESVDLQSEYRSSLAEFAQEQLHLLRVQAQLAGEHGHKQGLVGELEAVEEKLAILRVRLQSMAEKLTHTGLRTQLFRGKGGIPDLLVVRKGEDKEDTRPGFVAAEDTELLPGDVLEVSIRSESPL